MDPLSLAASVLTVAATGIQTVKLLKKLAALKNTPAAVLSLNNELSNLQVDVLVIQDLFRSHTEAIVTCSGQDATLSQNVIASTTSCLKRASDLVIELDHLLNPLLTLLSRPDRSALRKRLSIMKEEGRLRRLQQELHQVRVNMNTALEVVGLNVSVHLIAIANSVRGNMEKIKEHQARIEQSHSQQVVRLDDFMRNMTTTTIKDQQMLAERGNKKISNTASNLDISLNARRSSLEPGSAEKETCLSTCQPASQQCKCCCHRKHSNRSFRFLDGITGTLFVGHCRTPYLALGCNLRSCTQTCLLSDFLFTLTYFFPTWLLSWAIKSAFKISTSGFDYNFRVLNCVSYSSPIFQCAYQADVAGIEALLRSKSGSPFDVTPEPQRSVLGVAASRGYGKICDILIHAGADPFFVDYKNRSAVTIAWTAALTANNQSTKSMTRLLAFASAEDYASEYKLSLLHRGVLGLAQLDFKSLIGQTPLHIIDEPDAQGRTALFWAALRGDSEVVSLLLAAGADSNSRSNDGARVVTAAIMSNNARCVQAILQSNCDILFQQKDGYTALHHACRYEHTVQTVQAILDHGAAINAKTALGHTPLMIATFNKRTAVATLLVDSKADLNAQSRKGECALHYATMVGDHHSVRYLLERRADHRIITKRKETILHFAARRNGDWDLMKVLQAFDLGGMDVGDKSWAEISQLLNLTRPAEGDFEWRKAFDVLVRKILRTRSSEERLEREDIDKAV